MHTMSLGSDDCSFTVLCSRVCVLCTVKSRNLALESSVAALSSRLSQSEQDSSEVLKYLEQEVRRKDILTKSLSRDIRELHGNQVREKAERAKEYAQEVEQLESTFAQREGQLLDLNRLRHQEYNDLLLFSRIRGELLAELAQTKRVVLKNNKRHALQMGDLERKFLAARQRLLEESSARIAESRRSYKEEVGRELDLESSWIARENQKMGQELGFHQELIQRLQRSNQELQEVAHELQNTCRELERKDANYAASALRNAKVLKELQNKNDMLTKALEQLRKGERKAAITAAAALSSSSSSSASASSAIAALQSADGAGGDDGLVDRSLADMELELSKLRALTAIKSRENSAIERQIGLFKSQRNDVEVISADMIALVKAEIVARRTRDYARAVQQYRTNLDQLAQNMYQPRGIKALPAAGSSDFIPSSVSVTMAATVSSMGLHIQSDPRLPPPTIPQLDASKITLADFTLHDRERVLQLIFEKLNQTSTTAAGNTAAAAAAAAAAEESRPSSAVSLYTGNAGRRGSSSSNGSGSSTSLVLSRPQSSHPRSRPGSSTRPRSKPPSAARTRPLGVQPPQPQQPLPSVTQVDMRPSDYAQLSGLVGGSGRAQKMQQQRRSVGADEKESSFFPPRGDTPSELL